MATKIKSVKTRKARINFTFKNEKGEEVKGRTEKVCFGQFEEGTKKCNACSKRTKNTFLACSQKVLTEKAKTEKKAKKAVSRSKKPWACGVDMWLQGEEKSKMIERFIELGMKESPAKKFAGDLYTVGKHIIGKAKRKEGVIAKYVAFKLQKIGEEPKGDSSTIGFCRNFCTEIMKMENAI